MEIRRVQQDEWPQLRAIRLNALADAPDSFGTLLVEEEQLPDSTWMERTKWAVYVAVQDDVWLALARVCVDERPDQVGVCSMWVSPEHRRLGIGRRLLSAVIDQARQQGIRRMWLWVTESNESARHLYQTAGFIPTGRRKPLRSESALVEIEMARDLE